jgi:hypothetical protein
MAHFHTVRLNRNEGRLQVGSHGDLVDSGRLMHKLSCTGMKALSVLSNCSACMATTATICIE